MKPGGPPETPLLRSASMLDRALLETFAQVVEHRSFDRAARQLNITRGAVSQRVRALESVLARVLLIRTRPLKVTPAGELLLKHVKEIRALERQTLEQVLPPVQGGQAMPLALGVNHDSLMTWFAPLLMDLATHHTMALEVLCDDQDHSLERLRRGEVMACVSAEARAPAGFRADPLGIMDYVLVATPAFAARWFPAGLTVADVLQACAVVFDRDDGLHDAFLNRLFGFPVSGYPRHYIPSSTLMLSVVQASAGYGVLPALQVHGLLADGTLVNPCPRITVPVELYWHRWDHEPAVMQAVSDDVLRQAARTLPKVAGPHPSRSGSP